MNSTVESVVRMALRKLRVIDATEAPEAQDMEDSIAALNAYMLSLEALNIALGWSAVSNPGDEMPTPPELDRAIAYNLACEMSDEYGVTPSANLLQTAENGVALMRQQVMANTYARTEQDLPAAESQRCSDSTAFYNGH